MEGTSIPNTSKLAVGSVIQYVLPLSQHPVEPNKQWKARVIRIHSDTLLEVEVLEPGYEECNELVHLYQIKIFEDGSVI
jgi:hypothetical protein